MGRRIPLETVRYFFRSLICALNIVIGLEHVFYNNFGDLAIENGSQLRIIPGWNIISNDKFKVHVLRAQ